MKINWIFDEAKKIEDETISHRNNLHQIAEVGFSLEKTYEYIFKELEKSGCSPQRCGKMGITCTIEGDQAYTAFKSLDYSINTDDNIGEKVTNDAKNSFRLSKKCIALRADMDALKMDEKTDLPFKSKNGCMHSCGHDMHTAMLLSCAKILAKNKDKFSSNVKLIFQPAEEILEGAKDMIENGALESPCVSIGVMMHCLTNTNSHTGSIILPNFEACAPSADFFEIKVLGSGAHGAMPEKSVDPIIIGAHIILALEELITRECIGINGTVLTIGSVRGGKAANVIPESIVLEGTMRTYDEETRDRMKKRIQEISSMQAKSFRGNALVKFLGDAPVFTSNQEIAKSAYTCLKNAWDEAKTSSLFSKKSDVFLVPFSETRVSCASEDFSHFSHRIPCIMVGLASGKSEDGYKYPLHHPMTKFDENALLYGTVAYSILGISL